MAYYFTRLLGQTNQTKSEIHDTVSLLLTENIQEILHGNISSRITESAIDTLAKIVHHNKTTRHTIYDLMELETTLRATDAQYTKLAGYIQGVNSVPFKMGMYTELGIRILAATLLKQPDTVLHIDATGSVVKKVADIKKRVNYYAAVLPGNGRGHPPLPVAEYMTSDNGVASLTSWLMNFLYDAEKIATLKVQRVETDFSYALLHAVNKAFNDCSLVNYVNTCYKIATEAEVPNPPQTILHICTNHAIKAIVNGVGRQTKNKDVRNFYGYVCTRMLRDVSLPSVVTTFRHLCILVLSPNLGDEANRSLEYLQDIIKKKSADEDSSSDSDSEDEDSNNICFDFFHYSGPAIKDTLFAQHFRSVKNEVEANNVNTSGPENVYHCPKVIQYLVTTWMPVLPLWTGIIISKKDPQKTHHSNAYAEVWFWIVKNQILNKVLRRDHIDFVRVMYRTIQARYVRYVLFITLNVMLLT